MDRIQGERGDAARHVSTKDTMPLPLLFHLPSQHSAYYQIDTMKLRLENSSSCYRKYPIFLHTANCIKKGGWPLSSNASRRSYYQA